MHARLSFVSLSLLTALVSLCFAASFSPPIVPNPENYPRHDLTSSAKSPSPTPYNYTYTELEPPAFGNGGSFRQPYVRCLILAKKNPKVSLEFFHRHWRTEHADRTMSLNDTGVNIVRYVQFHQDQEHIDKLEPLFAGGRMRLAQYDGVAEFQARDAESLIRFFDVVSKYPEHLKDEESFLDTSEPYAVVVGYDNLIFGAEASTSGGEHGILPGDRRLKNTGDHEGCN